MKFTPQRVKFLHSIDGVNYSLVFFYRETCIYTLKINGNENQTGNLVYTVQKIQIKHENSERY